MSRIIGEIWDSTERSVSAGEFDELPIWLQPSDNEAYDPAAGTDYGLRAEAADVLAVPAPAVAPEGLFTFELRYRPHYAHGAPSTIHTLVYLTDDYQLFYRSSDQKFVLRLDGVDTESDAVTFASGDELTIKVEHSASRHRLEVSGAATGNGTKVGTGAPAAYLPSYGYLLGPGTSGSEEPSDLRYWRPTEQHFRQIFTIERIRIEYSEDLVLRDFIWSHIKGRARIYDAAICLPYMFDLDTATGDRLNKLGCVLGLSREGWTDARYRQFLKIQAELLVARGSADAEWTGTNESILRIARDFIGDANDDGIALYNSPPYELTISMPNALAGTEEGLFRRFLSEALYAGVLLTDILVDTASGSRWASTHGAVTAGGTWASTHGAVTGESSWGVALEGN